jgi:hypothetical protein
MKKILFVLILLIILGGTVFFLGWAQLTVPPGSYGVMRSKTHGLESQVISDGEFRWSWYKLIPTNAEISVFTLGPVKHSIRSSGSLPSGQVYASLAGLDADFSWEISGELSFSIRPEALPELTTRENVRTNEELRKAEENLALKIENLALQRLKIYAGGEDEKKMESLILTGSIPELNSEIQALFNEIENLNCAIRVVRYPDYALYQSVKALYQEYMTQQNTILKQDILRDAQKRIETRIRLSELDSYGELLTKYPVLIQYLSIGKDLLRAGE